VIICHCQSISDHDIRAAADWMRAADPQALITSGKV
jgi:bacterioferritin-associated ferredoxin